MKTESQLHCELHHVGIGGLYASATVPICEPIEGAISLIARAEKTVITRLECSIVVAAGCVLTVHRHNNEFVVTEVASPVFSNMPIATGRDRCAQLLKIYGVT